MAPDILALGEPLYELSEVDQGGQACFLPGFGGDVSNVAVAAARQGASVGMLTRLGSDAFGDRFMRLWNDEGVETEHVVRDPNASTGVYLISYDDDGHHFSYFRDGSAASRLSAAELPERAIAESRVLHLSGISQAISASACDAAFAAMEVARRHGVAVSYDTNLRLKLWPLARARAVIMASLAYCDYCLPSLEDARQLTGLDEPREIVAALLSHGAGAVLLKMGANGVLVATQNGDATHVPAFTVEAVDATGAGDCFDGALLAQVVRGEALLDAALYANAAAALSTLGHGAVRPLPRRHDVEGLLASARG
jgi:2-dehydro-3-deoxygluconokinase